MNVIDHAAAQVRFTDHIGDIIDLTAVYSRSADTAARQQVAEQIAGHYEAAADLLASSAFVRKMSAGMTGNTPDAMRAKAARWRAYGDPEEDNR